MCDGNFTPNQRLAIQGTDVFGKALTAGAGALDTKRALRDQADLFAMQAEDTKKRGAIAARERLKQGKRNIGTQRAVMAARNLDLTTGTPADIQAGEQLMAEIDALTIEEETRMNAAFQNYAAEASDFGASTINPFLEGAAPILSKGADVLRQDAELRKAGAGKNKVIK